MDQGKENKPLAAPVLGLKRPGGFRPPAFVKKAAVAGPSKAPLGQPSRAAAAPAPQHQHTGGAAAADAGSRYFSVLYTKFQPGKKVHASDCNCMHCAACAACLPCTLHASALRPA